MPEDFIIDNGILTDYCGEAHSAVVPAGVRIIGAGAFKGKAWLTDVTLPEGITEIGEGAFKGCGKLRSINFPEGLEKVGSLAFHRCHSLESALLPDSVKVIGQGAFLYCDSLKTVTARGVKHFENQTFSNNTQLTSIALNSGVDISNFRSEVFNGCVGLREITLSDGYCFRSENLISALVSGGEIHPVVKAVAGGIYQSLKIEDGVLYKMHIDLKAFELPEGIRCIEKSCFFDKKGIVSISFPESLGRIMTNAFGNCINLEQVAFRSADITVDEGAFRGCSSLKRIVIAGEVYPLSGISYETDTPYLIRQINDQVMSDFYISGRTLISYTGREERVTIPEGVEVIGESCFEGNEKLVRVIMSSTVREVQENAFRNCVCMLSAVMPEGLVSIRRSAFENCRKLIRFNVPAALREVGFAAFRGCTSLEVPGFEKTTPPAVRIDETVYSGEDIPAYSRCGDEGLTELVFDKPAVIGKYAFSGCKNLKTVIINSEGCVIERGAFEKCASLREIRVLAARVDKGAFSFCMSLERAELRGITSLADEVFAGCCSLKEVKLPEELTEIGRRCFDECTALQSIDLSGVRVIGERAFERCDSLTKVELTDAAAGYHAFADCSGLKTVVLDESTTLQSGVFFGCTFADTVVYCGESYAFSKFSQSRNTAGNPYPLRVQEVIGSVYSCFKANRELCLEKYRGDALRVKIPEDIVSIGDEAFRDHLRVAEIVFPKSVKYSGKLAFSGTGWLEKHRREGIYNIVNGLLIDAATCGETAEITGDIDRICSWAFAGSTALKELIIRNDRVAVDTFAFRNCLNLKKIHTPDGKIYTLEKVSDIGEKPYPDLVRRIFTECINCFKLSGGVLVESTGNIRDLVFPGGIKEIGAEVYMDCHLLESIVLSEDTAVIGRGAFKNSKWLRTVRSAGGVVRIEAQAFSGCKSLESIDLSDSLEQLGKRAFEHCCSLTEIHLSDRLEVIPEMAFFRCKSLKKVVIPASVREIGAQAFAYCSELEEVVFADRENVRVAGDAFAWCDRL